MTTLLSSPSSYSDLAAMRCAHFNSGMSAWATIMAGRLTEPSMSPEIRDFPRTSRVGSYRHLENRLGRGGMTINVDEADITASIPAVRHDAHVSEYRHRWFSGPFVISVTADVTRRQPAVPLPYLPYDPAMVQAEQDLKMVPLPPAERIPTPIYRQAIRQEAGNIVRVERIYRNGKVRHDETIILLAAAASIPLLPAIPARIDGKGPVSPEALVAARKAIPTLPTAPHSLNGAVRSPETEARAVKLEALGLGIGQLWAWCKAAKIKCHPALSASEICRLLAANGIGG